MAADVAGDFAAAGRVADMDRVLQVELLDQRRQVVGVGVHVVAVPGLARTPVTATVVRNAAISVRGQKNHLVFPGIRAQRPAVAENNRLSRAPVLVVDLRAVFGGDCCHDLFLSYLVGLILICGNLRVSDAGEISLRDEQQFLFRAVEFGGINSAG